MGTGLNTSIPIGMSSAVIAFGRGVFSRSPSVFPLCSKLFNNNSTLLEQEVLEPLVEPNA